MKKTCCPALLLLLAAYASPLEAADQKPGELIIKFRSTAKSTEVGKGIKAARLRIKKHLSARQTDAQEEDVVSLAETALPVEEALQLLKDNPAIEYAEPNHTYTHQVSSNDPYASNGSLWGAYGDLSSPSNAYGSQAAEAWKAGFTGSKNVYIGIIDEGVQITHPDLAPNIWTNPYDPADGIDNDRNGYIDDVNGWDFVHDRRNVFDAADGDTHGTHVAGTIGAKGGNGVGIAGINWNVTMIPAKFMSDGTGSTFDAVAAINYFIDLKKRHGLDLVAINASWGGSSYSRSLHDAVIRAANAGILFVAAAGNDALNNDLEESYPANINTTVRTTTQKAASFNSVISVAAIDKNGALASFSNHGSSRVHIGAPGANIYSTFPSNRYAALNGTSMAAPHVTGAIALYASTHPNATVNSIREAILSSAIPTDSLKNKTSSGGRLNLSTIISPPTSALNAVKITSVDKLQNGSIRISAYGIPGMNYQVEACTDLSSAPWTPLGTRIAVVDGGFELTDSSGHRARFYRIVPSY